MVSVAVRDSGFVEGSWLYGLQSVCSFSCDYNKRSRSWLDLYLLEGQTFPKTLVFSP